MSGPPAPRLRIRRRLDLAAGEHPRGVRHVAAASGLVAIGERLYAVADDEHHLAVFGRDPAEPARLHRLFAGSLPASKKKRKKRKPDLESLVAWPTASGTMLVGFGSGSRPNRERAVVVGLDAAGLPRGVARRIDLKPMYAPLRERFPELNIEGAFRLGDALCLLQRGNGGDPRNACIGYAWRDVEAWLDGTADAPARPRFVRAFELGRTGGGVPWTFTDGTALPGGGFAFTAVAEATDDAYADAPHRGSALGIVSAAGELAGFVPISRRHKIEGVAVVADRGRCRLAFVTDADDPDAPSLLLESPLLA